MMEFNPLITHGVSLLGGIFIGAAGAYYSELFTDRRREKEGSSSEMKRFKGIAAKMPDLFAEMKEDLAKPSLVLARKFYLVPDKVMYSPAPDVPLVYTIDESNRYDHKLPILEAQGYVIDITDSGLTKYQMTEAFVDLLRAHKT